MASCFECRGTVDPSTAEAAGRQGTQGSVPWNVFAVPVLWDVGPMSKRQGEGESP